MENKVFFRCAVIDGEGGEYAYFGPFAGVDAAYNHYLEGVRSGLINGNHGFDPHYLNSPETNKLSEIVVAAQVPRVV